MAAPSCVFRTITPVAGKVIERVAGPAADNRWDGRGELLSPVLREALSIRKIFVD